MKIIFGNMTADYKLKIIDKNEIKITPFDKKFPVLFILNKNADRVKHRHNAKNNLSPIKNNDSDLKSKPTTNNAKKCIIKVIGYDAIPSKFLAEIIRMPSPDANNNVYFLVSLIGNIYSRKAIDHIDSIIESNPILKEKVNSYADHIKSMIGVNGNEIEISKKKVAMEVFKISESEWENLYVMELEVDVRLIIIAENTAELSAIEKFT